MSRLPKAVAWDIDGTLIDSEPLHLAALVAVSARYGLDLSHEPEDRFRGRHMGDVWRALRAFYPGGLTEQRWADEIIDTYIESASSLRPMPGALETVRELHARGIPQACVSNSERRVVDANLKALGIIDLIEFSISRDDVTAGKPDPEPYLEACERELEQCGVAREAQSRSTEYGLTPSELVVARLVATGKSNREAAEELYVTVKTVEFHLRGVFAKLGITSRRQVAALLGDQA